MTRINFNKKFYNIKLIKLAAKVYNEVANFEFKENKKYIQVFIKNIDKKLENIIKDEFCNYVFYLMR